VISDTQNIAVTYSGDGPTRDLLFFLSFPATGTVATDVFSSLNLDPVARGGVRGTGDYARSGDSGQAGVAITAGTGAFTHGAVMVPGTSIANEVCCG
jgi:hypothetical protein